MKTLKSFIKLVSIVLEEAGANAALAMRA